MITGFLIGLFLSGALTCYENIKSTTQLGKAAKVLGAVASLTSGCALIGGIAS